MYTEQERDAILAGLDYLLVLVDDNGPSDIEITKKEISALYDRIRDDVIPCPYCGAPMDEETRFSEMYEGDCDEELEEFVCSRCFSSVQVYGYKGYKDNVK